MKPFVYRGPQTKEISFPLGGIGTGCIGLAGNGRLIDWEIANKPNKGSSNGFSHFAIKAESEGKVLDARVLNADLPAPYSGDLNRPHFGSFGFGPGRSSMAGMPHFRELEFEGTFPIARLVFLDEQFPGAVSMTAFNPFIPLNDADSSIPGAFFEFEVQNALDIPVAYTIAFSVNNPNPSSTAGNSYCKRDGHHAMLLYSGGAGAGPGTGDLCFATDACEASYQEYWYRGGWFDNLGCYWRDFTTFGPMRSRTYAPARDGEPGYSGSDVATLAAHLHLCPGERGTVRFVLTWSYPYCENYWNPEKCECADCGCDDSAPRTWKNYYATLFADSSESAGYCMDNWRRLHDGTLAFRDALFSSTLPKEALDAISANLSILKSPTCLRLEDGSFYGFEGCHCDAGCCEGSCTHVWNYAYALPFLFPKLERGMRDLDYRYNQREDGSMSFRLQLPAGRERWAFRACADGQFGGVIKTYREWKISGDTQWLKRNWEAVKKSIAFAWSPTNEDRWDWDKDGVLEGRQHHTLDMELFGPNAWLTGLYLAALKAGAQMAEYLGEKDTAAEYLGLFAKGKAWVDLHLFNGEYYQHQVDLTDIALLEKYENGSTITGETAVNGYWNSEAGEIKYQIGTGCIIDQVLAQWHANLVGLGDIFDREQVKSALQSIYKYNFKKSMRGFYNPCRLFSLNDEGGAVICEWPEGKYKPVVPVPYAEETMCGFEYQAAVHMIQEGLVEQGMEIVRAIRGRFDGEKRNPWNEFECGSNYARSMASYALLNAFSGFAFDMVNKMIGFRPIFQESECFACFWSLDSGYGTFSVAPGRAELKVLSGKLEICTVGLPFLGGRRIVNVALGGRPIGYEMKEGSLSVQALTVDPSNELVIEYDGDA